MCVTLQTHRPARGCRPPLSLSEEEAGDRGCSGSAVTAVPLWLVCGQPASTPGPGVRPHGAGLTSPCSSAGVDDVESECGLDDFGDFDWVIENHGDERHLQEQLENLLELVRSRL